MADGVPARLLRYLRGTLERDGLDYRAEPERLSGGNETFVYSFELADAPRPFSGPLVLRVFRDGEPDRARFEAAVQNALADAGYPAPRAHLAEDDPSHVGGLQGEDTGGAPVGRRRSARLGRAARTQLATLPAADASSAASPPPC